MDLDVTQVTSWPPIRRLPGAELLAWASGLPAGRAIPVLVESHRRHDQVVEGKTTRVPAGARLRSEGFRGFGSHLSAASWCWVAAC